MNFFLCTDPDETFSCDGCEGTIGFQSRLYYVGRKILCVNCFDEFEEKYKRRIFDAIDDFIEDFHTCQLKKKTQKAP